MGAMHPKLMGAAGQRLELQQGGLPISCQYLKVGAGGFAFLVYITQQAGQGTAGDGGIDEAFLRCRAAEYGGMVELLQFAVCMELIQQGVDMGVFRHEHHAVGVPVQTGDGVAGAALPCGAVVALDIIGKGAGQLRPGGVHQQPRRLIHSQQMGILIENVQLSILGGVVHLGLIQGHADHIPGLHGIVGVDGVAVDEKLILPLEPVHEAGGHAQLLLQKGRKAPLTGCDMGKFQKITSQR